MSEAPTQPSTDLPLGEARSPRTSRSLPLSPDLVRLVGGGAAVLALTLWALFVLANPYRDPGSGPVWVAATGAALALVALYAAWRGSGGVMVAVGVLAFVPVGLYVLATPGIFALIGICHLLWIACGVGLWRSRHWLA